MDGRAKELSATKLATGHNLDDEAQTILMNYLKGDMEKLRRSDGEHGFIKRIKPLREVLEREVALYGLLEGLIDTSECPYAEQSLRWNVRKMLNEFESNHPGTKYALVRGYEKIGRFLPMGRTLSTCERCGGGCTGKICKACELIEMIRSK